MPSLAIGLPGVRIRIEMGGLTRVKGRSLMGRTRLYLPSWRSWWTSAAAHCFINLGLKTPVLAVVVPGYVDAEEGGLVCLPRRLP